MVSPHHPINLEFPEVFFFSGTRKLMSTLSGLFCALCHGVLLINISPIFSTSKLLVDLLMLMAYNELNSSYDDNELSNN